MVPSRHKTDPTRHTDSLRQLVAYIDRVGLRMPLRFILDVLRPLDVLSSQAALFVSPFIRGSTWEQFTTALTQESGWRELRHLLESHQDSRETQTSHNFRKQKPDS